MILELGEGEKKGQDWMVGKSADGEKRVKGRKNGRVG